MGPLKSLLAWPFSVYQGSETGLGQLCNSFVLVHLGFWSAGHILYLYGQVILAALRRSGRNARARQPGQRSDPGGTERASREHHAQLEGHRCRCGSGSK